MPGSVLRVLVPAVMFATAVGAQVVRAPSPCDSPCPPNAMCATIRNCAPPAAQVVRSSSQVRVDLEGRVVRYEVTDTYINRGTIVGEADYLLPLPKGAAFEDMALSINGEMVTGETMGADRARAVYEEIVRRMRDPALVEWMGHGLLRTRIFPIQPGETKRVVARFRAVAEREDVFLLQRRARQRRQRGNRARHRRRDDGNLCPRRTHRTGGGEERRGAGDRECEAAAAGESGDRCGGPRCVSRGD